MAIKQARLLRARNTWVLFHAVPTWGDWPNLQWFYETNKAIRF